MEIQATGQMILQSLLALAQFRGRRSRQLSQGQVERPCSLQSGQLGLDLGGHLLIRTQVAHDLFARHAKAQFEIRSGMPTVFNRDPALAAQLLQRLRRQIQVGQASDVPTPCRLPLLHLIQQRELVPRRKDTAALARYRPR